MPARDYHYHLHDHPALDGSTPFGFVEERIPTNDIPPPSPPKYEKDPRRFYSLRRDLHELRKLAAKNKILVGSESKEESVGTGSGGRLLWVLKIGNGATHKVLFTGCHHAREWISVEVPYLVAEYLVENYDDNPTTTKGKRIKHLLMNREIWFVPMVNPEGHEWSRTVNRYWRGNRRVYPGSELIAINGGPTINAQPMPDGGCSGPRAITIDATTTYIGVDLNRNYATASWGLETCIGGGRRSTSRDPADCSAMQNGGGTWCGPGPSSEKETKAIDGKMRAPKFRADISYHNAGQYLLYPRAAKGDEFIDVFLGKGLEKLINDNKYGTKYEYKTAWELYPTTGASMIYSYENSPHRPTYTPELRPHKGATPQERWSGLPESEIEGCFKENLPPALALVNAAGHNEKSGKKTLTVTWSAKPQVVQVVRNCWKVFLGWKP
jgi:carboxypeptidase T